MGSRKDPVSSPVNHPLESVQIAQRDLREPRQQRPEAFDEVRIAVGRERAQGEPVKRVVGRDHP